MYKENTSSSLRVLIENSLWEEIINNNNNNNNKKNKIPRKILYIRKKIEKYSITWEKQYNIVVLVLLSCLFSFCVRSFLSRKTRPHSTGHTISLTFLHNPLIKHLEYRNISQSLNTSFGRIMGFKIQGCDVIMQSVVWCGFFFTKPNQNIYRWIPSAHNNFSSTYVSWG